MAVYHWCDGCGWIDETEMCDVATCYCGRRVDSEEPREPFEAFCRREDASGLSWRFWKGVRRWLTNGES